MPSLHQAEGGAIDSHDLKPAWLGLFHYPAAGVVYLALRDAELGSPWSLVARVMNSTSQERTPNTWQTLITMA